MSPRARAVAAAAAAAVLVAVLGRLATDLGPWYAGLRQPPWKPADLWFGPAWTAIYAFTTLGGARAWLAAPAGPARDGVLALFAVNAFLNVLWSLLFFRLQRPDWALLEVGVFWSSIVALVVAGARHSVVARWLLAPYLAWVSFAAVLNLAVVQLNGPFGPR